MSFKSFQILIDRWLGVRQENNPLLISEREWADSNNVDDRLGWPRDGLKDVVTVTSSARGYWTYNRPDGTLHEVWVGADGNIYEDGTAVGSSVTLGTQSLSAAAGNGTIVIARGNGRKPWYRVQSTGAWAELTTAPYAFETVGMMSRGPRLVGAPGGLGVDSIAWSAPSDFTKWGTADGGGAEVIGMDSEPVRVILDGLQDDFAIYKDNSIWMIRGGNPTTWEVMRASTDVGSITAAGTVKIGRGHAAIHTSGIYLVNALGQVTWPPLTWKIQNFWDTIKNSSLLRKAFMTYNSTTHLLSVWVPTTSSSDLPFSKLIQFYLPTSSVSFHTLSAGAAGYHKETTALKVFQGTNKFIMGGNTDNTAAIASSLTLPIFAGIPHIPSRIEYNKRWGHRDRIYLIVESRDTSAITLSVTPTIYRDSTSTVLTVQNLTVPAVATSMIPLTLQPTNIGWGLQLKLDFSSSNGGLRLLGIAGMIDEIADLN